MLHNKTKQFLRTILLCKVIPDDFQFTFYPQPSTIDCEHVLYGEAVSPTDFVGEMRFPVKKISSHPFCVLSPDDHYLPTPVWFTCCTPFDRPIIMGVAEQPFVILPFQLCLISPDRTRLASYLLITCFVSCFLITHLSVILPILRTTQHTHLTTMSTHKYKQKFGPEKTRLVFKFLSRTLRTLHSQGCFLPGPVFVVLSSL